MLFFLLCIFQFVKQYSIGIDRIFYDLKSREKEKGSED